MDDEKAVRRDAHPVREFLTYVVVPAWLAAGVLDWYWHRVTKIECTSGAHESITHVLMAMEGGVGVAAGMLLETDAGVLATMAGSALLHEATAIWDVGYTAPRRLVAPREQHTHSFLEVLPFAGLAFAAFVHRDQALALVGRGREQARFRFRPSRTPPPLATYVALAASGLFGVLPHVEELVRCLRTKPTLAPLPARGAAAGSAGGVLISR